MTTCDMCHAQAGTIKVQDGGPIKVICEDCLEASAARDAASECPLCHKSILICECIRYVKGKF